MRCICEVVFIIKKKIASHHNHNERIAQGRQTDGLMLFNSRVPHYMAFCEELQLVIIVGRNEITYKVPHNTFYHFNYSTFSEIVKTVQQYVLVMSA